MKTWTYSAAIILPLAALAVAWGDGAGGRPRTPYGARATVSVSVVEQTRRLGRTLRCLYVSDRWPALSRVGFAYVRPGAPIPAATYELHGRREDGTRASVDLASLETLTLLLVDQRGARALCEMELMPSITAAELVALQPTYSRLVATASRRVRMWVWLGGRASGSLAFVGVRREFDEERASVQFVNLPLRVRLRLDAGITPAYNPVYWWAIPSVVDDPNYPHRQATAAA